MVWQIYDFKMHSAEKSFPPDDCRFWYEHPIFLYFVANGSWSSGLSKQLLIAEWITVCANYQSKDSRRAFGGASKNSAIGTCITYSFDRILRILGFKQCVIVFSKEKPITFHWTENKRNPSLMSNIVVVQKPDTCWRAQKNFMTDNFI